MATEIMTVHIPTETREELDAVAAALHRDRDEVVSEALAAYLDLQRWQVEHIQQGLREAEAGQFVPEAEVEQVIQRLRQLT